jgi:hypothetical protein
MRADLRVFAVVEKVEEELTALNDGLITDAIAKMEKADAAIFDRLT